VQTGKRSLTGLSPGELSDLAEEYGEKRYRGVQLFEQLHARLATDLSKMTVLPATFRDRLAQNGWLPESLDMTEVRRSEDGTVKFGCATSDGHMVESVLIGMEGKSHTQCISSQIGCALGCAMCMTGTMGFARNLTAAEIVEQHLLALREFPDAQVRNLVFMGMGEPLLNFDEVKRAIGLLQEERGRDISYRRITVSTAGLVPGIRRLGKESNALLAVSLNAPNQELREKLMPVARRHPLPELMAAMKAFPLRPRQRITVEYVLVKGVNDSLSHAAELVKLLSGIRCKVNLIRFNPFPGCALGRPAEEAVEAFASCLADKQMTVTVRKSKGVDIQAACGQLVGSKQE